MNRKGDWMSTFTGRQFWPMDPRPEDVHIDDISHALSLICRFGGHCNEFYSVAQHCCLVSDLVLKNKPQFALHALLHDAAEAYVGDVIRPLKRSCSHYDEVEAVVMSVICQRFGLDQEQPEVVTWADNVVLSNEHRLIKQDGRSWGVDDIEGPTISIVPVSSAYAKVQFTQLFHQLEEYR